MHSPLSSATKAPARAISERRLVFIVAAVQFVNILDFMIVMPLGPDFATALGIPMSLIGVVGGSYTLAAAVSGVLGSIFLDRFDRRVALGCAMTGLVLATAAGGLAVGLPSLVAARVVAGMFGGPATSLAVAAVTDAVPAARRGRAMGTVMGAFSVASVLGVPAGLELSRLFSWRMPFFAVAALGVLVTTIALLLLPPMRRHLIAPTLPPLAIPAATSAPATLIAAPHGLAPNLPNATEKSPLLDRLALLSLSATFATMLGVFAIVPNIAAYFQYNLGYPRERLGLLYLVGGIASFFALHVTGRLVDRFGATRLVVVGTAVHVFALWTGFVRPTLAIPALLVFVAFMLSGSIRMVPTSSLATRVPRSAQRARFLSAQSAVQHFGSALGAMLSAAVLVAEPSGKLLNMEYVALGALLMALCVPLIAARVEAGVRKRELQSVILY